MPDVATVYDGTETYRTVTTEDETHRFLITGDESTPDGYEYEGEGDAPDDVADALLAWIREHHDNEHVSEDTEGEDAGTDGSAAQ